MIIQTPMILADLRTWDAHIHMTRPNYDAGITILAVVSANRVLQAPLLSRIKGGDYHITSMTYDLMQETSFLP